MLKAYSIREKVFDLNINETQSGNIEKIIKRVLGEDEHGKPGEVKLFNTDKNIENHKLHRFATEIMKEPSNSEKVEAFCDRLAEDLLKAELIEDQSTRNKNILEGVLIVKITEDRLILLKFEDVEVIDRITFEIRSTIGLDRAYLKAAIFTGDETTIRIIDRQRQVANFWSSKFLELIPVRTDEDNTLAVANSITRQEVLNEETYSKEEIKTATFVLAEYLTKESHFDLREASDLLLAKFPGKPLELTSLFQVGFLQSIDEQFDVSTKAINVAFQRKVKLNEYVTLVINNIFMARNGQLINEQMINSSREIGIRIDDSCFNDVLEILGNSLPNG
jgi:hypothetical protein